MLLKRILASAFICCAFVVIYCADARAEDWLKKEFEVAAGGILEFEFPPSWGKKPEYDFIDGVTNIRFGPYGPKSKPIFLLNVMAGVSTQAINSDQLLEITKTEVEKFRPTAFETDIPISAFQGPHMSAHLFSITDSE